MRTLAELNAIVAAKHHRLPRESRYRICAACTRSVCDPKAANCAAKKAYNAKVRRQYAKNPQRKLDQNRAYRAKPEVKEKIMAWTVQYRQESKSIRAVKDAAFYKQNKAAILRKRRERQKQRKLQEGATQ